MRHSGCVLVFLAAAALTQVGCSPEDAASTTGSGGSPGAGGAANPGAGGLVGTGTGGAANPGSGGAASAGTGGAITASGGATGSGGAATGGAGSGGRAGTAGATGTGGAGSGGSATGGSASGGNAGGTAGSSSSTGGAGGSPGVPLDSTLMARCTGTNPIICTIPVPANGNYTVTVELGSATVASTSRVQAELYRIVVPPVTLAAGAFSQQTFAVNVRAEKHDGYSAVEKVLNLQIDGSAPALHGLGFAAAATIPTIFVAGDSTVCDWEPTYAPVSTIERGWAQEVSQFLLPTIAVANYADSGETAGTFYSGFWAPAKAALRAGDFVFIQFGHNDQKVDLTLYKPGLLKYITDARAKNAIPILFTPPARKAATTADPGFAGLDQQARDLAAAENVALVDLTNLSLAYYKTVADKSVLFASSTEGTHFSETGATALASAVTKDLRANVAVLKAYMK